MPTFTSFENVQFFEKSTKLSCLVSKGIQNCAEVYLGHLQKKFQVTWNTFIIINLYIPFLLRLQATSDNNIK